MTLTPASATTQPGRSTSPARPAVLAPSATGDGVVGPIDGCPRPFPDLSSIKGVLFDVDGTLCNSDPLHLQIFQHLLQDLGFNDGQVIDEEFFRQRIAGGHTPHIFADLFPSWTEEKCQKVSEEKESAYRALAVEGGLEQMPGLSDFLAWLRHRGLGRVAVTNAPRLNAECMLEGMGIAHEFNDLIIGAECTRAKPFPDPYLRGLEALGIDASEAIAIEDSPSGMRAAVAARIPTVGILSGQAPEALREAGASYLIRDYRDLMALISYSRVPQCV
mmetsp:Transcript_8422/g.24149  ORF Transcript_8422/g.24149 Transcript_8422/m.24149 type:complete len:275 (+) Transcript_8422:199-1023(+)